MGGRGRRFPPSGSTASVSTFVYGAGSGGGGRGPRFRIDEYVIVGRVVLEDGTPVRGATVRIGDAVVHTDGGGGFVLRRPRRGTHELEVLVGEFLTPGYFEVVSAPPEARAAREEEAAPVVIVVRRRGHQAQPASAVIRER